MTAGTLNVPFPPFNEVTAVYKVAIANAIFFWSKITGVSDIRILSLVSYPKMHLVATIGTPAPASSISEGTESTIIQHYPAKLLEFLKFDFRFLLPNQKNTGSAPWPHSKNFKNPAVYLQVDDHVHPGNCLAAVSSEKKPSSYGVLPSPAELGYERTDAVFSSVSDEWSRDLKSVQVLKQLSCRAWDLDESPDPSMSKIVLRNLIISSKYYKEEEAKEVLEVITAERLETEQQQKLEQQEQLSIENLRLEMELSRIANQSATQNNGQTSRVKSLDEIVKMVRLLTVKVPNKSDGWEYFFSGLEKAFASEMVSDELKPKVLLCMLGDKVLNLLVNLGEEELKDYESLKQVVLKEYEPSPKICLENFKKAKRSSDETFSQFGSRLTSMWLYYCKLRGANDFESVNQLIVADKMFEMLDSEIATHIGVLQGEEWYKPRDLGKQCDTFYASKGKSYDEPEKAKWNDSEKRSFNGSGVNSHLGRKSQIIFLLGKTLIRVK
ncbi:retrovirus-related Pol polyprotein from transposon opus [Trichonephila clavipes]|nr:retrovirus-related Pol polyprotein from transposon opus [Trichonephila clavipes]